MFEIGNEVDCILGEVRRLRTPKILLAPLMYQVEDNHLYLIPEVSSPPGTRS